MSVVQALTNGQEPVVAYRLSDMAADAVAVLDELRIEKAHVMGVSVGGMIVQQLAIDHPGRLLSMTSAMSTTGDPDVGQSSPEALAILLGAPAADRASAVSRAQELMRITGSPAYYDAERVGEPVLPSLAPREILTDEVFKRLANDEVIQAPPGGDVPDDEHPLPVPARWQVVKETADTSDGLPPAFPVRIRLVQVLMPATVHLGRGYPVTPAVVTLTQASMSSGPVRPGAVGCDVARLQTWVGGIDVEGDDPLGVNTDDLRRQMIVGRGGAHDGFGGATDLQEVRPCHARFRHLVDDEGDAGVGPDVAVLSAAAHVEPGDVDRPKGGVVGEAEWLHLGRSIGSDGRQVTSGLADEEPLLGIVKSHEPNLGP